MDGLEATRRIMRTTPTPVVVVSGLLEREIDLSFRALQAGALAVLPKPPARSSSTFAAEQQRLLNTLRAMSGVKLVRRWASVYETIEHNGHTDYERNPARPSPLMIAVAASAGGPSALATLVGGLQNRLSVPMVVVQHMPGEFLGGLARWLGRFTTLPVRTARDGETLQAGTIYLAPSHAHLRVYRRHGAIVAALDDERGNHHHHPAADVLFESVAGACGARGVGVVLTGMGTDGARGLLAIKQQGGRTFAQDERSSTVYGMPGAAVRLGAADEVMSPGQLAVALRKLMT